MDSSKYRANILYLNLYSHADLQRGHLYDYQAFIGF